MWINYVTNLAKKKNFLFIPNLINPILFHKNIHWYWSFHIPHGTAKAAHIKSVALWITAIPSFINLLQNIYFIYDIIDWWGMSDLVGEGELIVSRVVVNRHILFLIYPVKKKESTRMMWQEFWFQPICISRTFDII